MKPQGFTGYVFTFKSLHLHEMLVLMQIPGVLFLRHAVVFLHGLPRKLLSPIL